MNKKGGEMSNKASIKALAFLSIVSVLIIPLWIAADSYQCTTLCTGCWVSGNQGCWAEDLTGLCCGCCTNDWGGRPQINCCCYPDSCRLVI